MHANQTWNLDPTRILTRRELATVLTDGGKAARSANTWRNLIIVRLACCCGLRVSEIGGLQLDDVVVELLSARDNVSVLRHGGRPTRRTLP